MATKPKPKPNAESNPEPQPAASVAPTAPVEPAADSASAAPEAHTAPRASFLESVRRNRMGVLTAALVVALVFGLLLSVLVPNKPGALAMLLLGTLLAVAVGSTVRYLSQARGLVTQVVAFVATTIGVHVMAVTGVASGSIPALEQLGVGGPSFNDALVIAFAIPAISTGGVVAGLVAVIIAGWGPKPVGRIELD